MTDASAPLLLVGAQRSGTTALAYALSGEIARRGGCFTVNGRLPHLLRRWWTAEDFRAYHVRGDEVVHSLTRRSPEGTGAVEWRARAARAVLHGAFRVANHGPELHPLEEVRRICAEAYASPIWGDKYNEHLLDLEWLHACFPEARWVFLAREPEEVVSSMLAWTRRKPWNPTSAEAAGDKWAHFNGRWLGFRNSVEPAQRLEIDYAALSAGDGWDALATFVGADLSQALAGFKRRAGSPASWPLSRAAEAMRDEMRGLGLLGGAAPASVGGATRS
jgi:hypothetical protein